MQPNINLLIHMGDDRTTGRLVLSALGLVFLGAICAFACAARGPDTLPGELSSSLWLQSWRSAWLDAVMKAVSFPGFRASALPLVGLTTIALYATGKRKESIVLLGAILVSAAVVTLVGEVVARPRPTETEVEILGGTRGFSFPSGHVTQYVVYLGTLSLLFGRRVKPGVMRRLSFVGLVIVLLGVGASRMYLGAHWLGDVVASYVIGAAIVAGVFGLWRRIGPGSTREDSLAD
jgi:undecaprenyl-diphosphatase